MQQEDVPAGDAEADPAPSSVDAQQSEPVRASAEGAPESRQEDDGSEAAAGGDGVDAGEVDRASSCGEVTEPDEVLTRPSAIISLSASSIEQQSRHSDRSAALPPPLHHRPAEILAGMASWMSSTSLRPQPSVVRVRVTHDSIEQPPTPSAGRMLGSSRSVPNICGWGAHGSRGSHSLSDDDAPRSPALPRASEPQDAAPKLGSTRRLPTREQLPLRFMRRSRDRAIDVGLTDFMLSGSIEGRLGTRKWILKAMLADAPPLPPAAEPSPDSVDTYARAHRTRHALAKRTFGPVSLPPAREAFGSVSYDCSPSVFAMRSMPTSRFGDAPRASLLKATSRPLGLPPSRGPFSPPVDRPRSPWVGTRMRPDSPEEGRRSRNAPARQLPRRRVALATTGTRVGL
jgi:hypothetical protein